MSGHGVVCQNDVTKCEVESHKLSQMVSAVVALALTELVLGSQEVRS